MNRWIRYFPLIFLIASPLLAQTADVQSSEKADPDREDMEALRRWIRDKRLVTVKEIGGDLSLSGEVRTEFQATNEKRNGVQQRGKDGVFSNKPMYGWDVEVNIMLDYRTDRTWAAIKIEFDDDMGTRSGTVNKIKLEKAYLGGRLVAGDAFTMDAELGRRNLYNVFDSKVEFGSLYDGLLFRFSQALAYVGDLYANVGALLVNDNTDHYGLVTEIGALRIANVGLNLKYSAIDWYRPGGETERGATNAQTQLTDLRFRYIVSQFLASYQFYPEWMGRKLIKFYGAALTNHLALKNPLAKADVLGQAFGKQNWGWYAGVSLGLVKKQGDWAIDANYQWVQAQTVPQFDVLGIGRGNAAGTGLYTVNTDGTGGATTRATAVGGCNYKGFELEGLYAFTDNLTVQQSFKMSWTLDKHIGPDLNYKQYEIEFIYAF